MSTLKTDEASANKLDLRHAAADVTFLSNLFKFAFTIVRYHLTDSSFAGREDNQNVESILNEERFSCSVPPLGPARNRVLLQSRPIHRSVIQRTIKANEVKRH